MFYQELPDGSSPATAGEDPSDFAVFSYFLSKKGMAVSD
jgi:hypothetical protein